MKVGTKHFGAGLAALAGGTLNVQRPVENSPARAKDVPGRRVARHYEQNFVSQHSYTEKGGLQEEAYWSYKETGDCVCGEMSGKLELVMGGDVRDCVNYGRSCGGSHAECALTLMELIDTRSIGQRSLEGLKERLGGPGPNKRVCGRTMVNWSWATYMLTKCMLTSKSSSRDRWHGIVSTCHCCVPFIGIDKSSDYLMGRDRWVLRQVLITEFKAIKHKTVCNSTRRPRPSTSFLHKAGRQWSVLVWLIHNTSSSSASHTNHNLFSGKGLAWVLYAITASVPLDAWTKGRPQRASCCSPKADAFVKNGGRHKSTRYPLATLQTFSANSKGACRERERAHFFAKFSS